MTDRRTMRDETLEGWCTDPYDRHEARWLSDGRPTKLVRDGSLTSYDDPPDGPWVKAPELLEPDPTAAHGSDLMRADAAESGDAYDEKKAKWAVYDQLAAQPPSAFDDVSRRRPRT
jgi:hypothetical protein